MTQYYYIDARGTKRGPCDEQLLKELARHGAIKPDTLLETDTAETEVAGQIPGLVFRSSLDSKLSAGCGVFTVILVIGLLALLIPAVQEAREAARRMQCSCKCLTLAFHTYHDVHGTFPPAYTVDENGKPLHSWRVLLLPYLEQKELYDKIRLDEPWDSEYNRQFHDVHITPYRCPSCTGIDSIKLKNRGTVRSGNCNYSVVIGDDTLFPGSRAVSLNELTKSTSEAILYVERMIPVCWMDPNNEIRFDTACEGINRNLLGIGSEHPGGANAGFADGSVRFLKESADGRIPFSNYYGQENYKSIKLLLTKSDSEHSSE
jgi:prepilin-type processing-associated H-X9-DG protein